MHVALTRVAARALLLGLAFPLAAAELARFEIEEPLGQDWPNEWLTQEVELDIGNRSLNHESLRLTQGGVELPSQFYRLPEDVLLTAPVTGQQRLKILFQASIPKNSTHLFIITDDGDGRSNWEITVTKDAAGNVVQISNSFYEIGFDPASRSFIESIRCRSDLASVGHWRWPPGMQPQAVQDRLIEIGPAQVILERTFGFGDPAAHCSTTFTFRANDPWIDVEDHYALGEGLALEIDLQPLNPDTVYHPYAYNARTFKAGGPDEDSTLQPPQHPIATLGPIWRDIWFGGGPFAFIYHDGSDCGIGFAAVRGSQWRTPPGISPESQNLEVHGHPDREGEVFVRVPMDGAAARHWAIIVGPPNLRKRLETLTRSHADIPLDVVRHEWVLDWESDAPEFKAGAAGVYLGSHFNRHFFNPTTFPRSVRRQIDSAFSKAKHVKSRDLAVLAYVFTNPDYWPGPAYPWRIGNPNFHTDMYNIPLKIGLLMPDHPHAERWVQFGVEETYGNIMRDSFPRGAWTESISYAGFFYHIAENVALLRDYGVTNGFKHWPRLRECATFLAAMHTPVDPRYGTRQKAPIGDTSPGNYIEQTREMAEHYRDIDEGFAEQLSRFPDEWEHALDLGSRPFPGFGAMLRGNAYDPRHESFVTIKAGPARNHYQGDELSFHFASLGVPLAIDHACHYSPRPWSASIHNRPDMNNKRPVAVAEPRAFASDATTGIHRLQGGPAAIGKPRAFGASEVADVFVADERTTRINEVPIEPHHAVKPGWEYPTTYLPEDKAWVMRRYAMLVKHDPDRSRIPDYLVIRDETVSPEPIWWNLHVLARSVETSEVPGTNQSVSTYRFSGQLDVDLAAHFLNPKVTVTETRQWGWSGKSSDRRTRKGDEYEQQNFGRIIPHDFERGSWVESDGERTQWLRVRGDAGRTEWLVVLMPSLQGNEAPTVEKLSPTSARVSLGDETEVVHLGTAGRFQAAVERQGAVHVLLEAGQISPLDRSARAHDWPNRGIGERQAFGVPASTGPGRLKAGHQTPPLSFIPSTAHEPARSAPVSGAAMPETRPVLNLPTLSGRELTAPGTGALLPCGDEH